MNIRKAKAEDLAGITEIWKEFMDYHKELDIFFTRSAEGHLNFKKFISSNLGNDEFLILVMVIVFIRK